MRRIPAVRPIAPTHKVGTGCTLCWVASSFFHTLWLCISNEARACFGKLVQNGKAISDFKKMSFGPMIAQVEDNIWYKVGSSDLLNIEAKY